MDIEDPSTIDRHQAAITEELAKSKPRDTVLLPLMKNTYGERRLFIVNGTSSISDTKTRYPALNRPAVVRLSYYALVHAITIPMTYRLNRNLV
jgi:hypothetical protein